MQAMTAAPLTREARRDSGVVTADGGAAIVVGEEGAGGVADEEGAGSAADEEGVGADEEGFGVGADEEDVDSAEDGAGADGEDADAAACLGEAGRGVKSKRRLALGKSSADISMSSVFTSGIVFLTT
jgi:hypothetical protein